MAITPRPMANILPSSATNYERTLASQVDRLLDLGISIKDLWNPWTCPIDMLPYLAWTLSVDIWSDLWPDQKKRSVVAHAIDHHRIKGTLAGIETYVDLIGAKVLSAVQPPSKIFSGPSLTREQRETWLAKLPQVRVWRQYEKTTRGHKMFSGGFRHSNFVEASYSHPNDAIVRLRRRSRWVVDGVETETKVEDFESYFRVFVRSHSGKAVFSKKPIGKRFFQPSTAASRVVTIEPLSTSPWRNAVGPRLTPVTSEPELVSVRGQEGRSVYSGKTFGKRFFVPSTANFRIFERYAVMDGTGASKRPSIQFMGVGRYGIKPKSAEVKVAIYSKRSQFKAGEGITAPKQRFWIPHDDGPMRELRHAIKASKRMTDKVLIDTNTKPGFIAGLPFFAGDSFIA